MLIAEYRVSVWSKSVFYRTAPFLIHSHVCLFILEITVFVFSIISGIEDTDGPPPPYPGDNEQPTNTDRPSFDDSIYATPDYDGNDMLCIVSLYLIRSF